MIDRSDRMIGLWFQNLKKNNDRGSQIPRSDDPMGSRSRKNHLDSEPYQTLFKDEYQKRTKVCTETRKVPFLSSDAKKNHYIYAIRSFFEIRAYIHNIRTESTYFFRLFFNLYNSHSRDAIKPDFRLLRFSFYSPFKKKNFSPPPKSRLTCTF